MSITIDDIRNTYVDAHGDTPATRHQAELAFNAALKDYVETQMLDAGYSLERTNMDGTTVTVRRYDGTVDGNLEEPSPSCMDVEVECALAKVREAKEQTMFAVFDCDVEESLYPLAYAANQLQVVDDTLMSVLGEEEDE